MEKKTLKSRNGPEFEAEIAPNKPVTDEERALIAKYYPAKKKSKKKR